MRTKVLAVGCVGAIFPALIAFAQGGWSHYGGDEGGSRYSEAKQINRQNVSQLQLAWTYRTGDVSDGADGRIKSKFEVTPILFNGSLYVSTPFNRVIALDPATGKQRWVYDPELNLKTRFSEGLVSRGISAWNNLKAREGTACKHTLSAHSTPASLRSMQIPASHAVDLAQMDKSTSRKEFPM